MTKTIKDFEQEIYDLDDKWNDLLTDIDLIQIEMEELIHAQCSEEYTYLLYQWDEAFESLSSVGIEIRKLEGRKNKLEFPTILCEKQQKK